MVIPLKGPFLSQESSGPGDVQVETSDIKASEWGSLLAITCVFLSGIKLK